MQCYPGRAREREKKNKPRICEHGSKLSIMQKVSTQPSEHKEVCRFMNRGLKFDYFLLQSKQLSFKERAFYLRKKKATSHWFIILERKQIVMVEEKKGSERFVL